MWSAEVRGAKRKMRGQVMELQEGSASESGGRARAEVRETERVEDKEGRVRMGSVAMGEGAGESVKERGGTKGMLGRAASNGESDKGEMLSEQLEREWARAVGNKRETVVGEVDGVTSRDRWGWSKTASHSCRLCPKEEGKKKWWKVTIKLMSFSRKIWF